MQNNIKFYANICHIINKIYLIFIIYEKKRNSQKNKNGTQLIFLHIYKKKEITRKIKKPIYFPRKNNKKRIL